MHYSGKEIFKYPEGLDNLKKAFKDRFPQLTAEIDLYYSHIARAGKAMNENMLFINLKPKWIANILNKWTNADYYYYEDKSV